MKKHRGEIVEEASRKSGFPIKKLAERLKISRNTLYNRFKDPELSYEFISAVGNIIHYNFAIDFPELESEENQTGEGHLNYVNRDTAELLKLAKKYTELLERYNELLSILIKVANNNELETLRKQILRFLDDNPT
ncbi:MAG: helix-turn-helix domain-containing protein [Bacteroidota bacterium]